MNRPVSLSELPPLQDEVKELTKRVETLEHMVAMLLAEGEERPLARLMRQFHQNETINRVRINDLADGYYAAKIK